jgi:hypothetical protein
MLTNETVQMLCVCACVRACVRVCSCVHAPTHPTHTHTHTHTQLHKELHLRFLLSPKTIVSVPSIVTIAFIEGFSPSTEKGLKFGEECARAGGGEREHATERARARARASGAHCIVVPALVLGGDPGSGSEMSSSDSHAPHTRTLTHWHQERDAKGGPADGSATGVLVRLSRGPAAEAQA